MPVLIPPPAGQNQDKFLMEEVDVIVATIAFGMGIDKPDVRFVIHYDMPKSLEGYYQETGRSGRDDGEGNCLAFYSYDDIQKLEKFMKDKAVAEQEIANQLLLETVSYAESSVCRRKQLLHYFGEIFPKIIARTAITACIPKKNLTAKNMLSLFWKLYLQSNSSSSTNILSISLSGKNSPTSNHTSTINWKFSAKALTRMRNSGMQ